MSTAPATTTAEPDEVIDSRSILQAARERAEHRHKRARVVLAAFTADGNRVILKVRTKGGMTKTERRSI